MKKKIGPININLMIISQLRDTNLLFINMSGQIKSILRNSRIRSPRIHNTAWLVLLFTEKKKALGSFFFFNMSCCLSLQLLMQLLSKSSFVSLTWTFLTAAVLAEWSLCFLTFLDLEVTVNLLGKQFAVFHHSFHFFEAIYARCFKW